MTAAEVVDQLKTLDPQERAKVLDHLLDTQSKQSDPRMDDKEFDRVAERVLKRHADLLRTLAR